ncbi:MAG TPA: aspartate aminotransferase family protein [Flavitalea sp.]|nr:aspartate aminotransferase family protein [Flavitalea sp.]
MNFRQLFFQYVAQTSSSPIAIEVAKAEGSKIWDVDGKQYIDLIAGISVCNIGHRHPKVIKAIKKQLDDYMHVLVYGEMIQSPQVQYAQLLTQHLHNSLNSVYFTNSGAEAVEGAMKLAKRVTGRTQIIAFKQSYHGSTQGALSVIGDEYWRNAFRPLLPGILHLDYNSLESLEYITSNTACVIVEPVQAERGVHIGAKKWFKSLHRKCKEAGALLIVDEIQTGFGRTGTLWGFQQFKVVPDIVLLGKALGGGMPMGAFISNRKLMTALSYNPVLGHITTFGGHPVCCAAGLAAFKVLLKSNVMDSIKQKEALFHQYLHHPKIKAIRSIGLLVAIEFENEATCKKIVHDCIANGALTDWFLFAPECLRIAPPLTISRKEIKKCCRIIHQTIAGL